MFPPIFRSSKTRLSKTASSRSFNALIASGSGHCSSRKAFPIEGSNLSLKGPRTAPDFAIKQNNSTTIQSPFLFVVDHIFCQVPARLISARAVAAGLLGKDYSSKSSAVHSKITAIFFNTFDGTSLFPRS